MEIKKAIKILKSKGIPFSNFNDLFEYQMNNIIDLKTKQAIERVKTFLTIGK